jgi:hypothetical protein
MLSWIVLNGVGPAPKMRLDFAKRITVLTGDNGFGKSFLLDVAWWTLTRTWAGNRALPRTGAEKPTIEYVVRGKTGDPKHTTSFYDRESENWKRPAGRPTMPGIVIYARVDGSFSVWDPARNYGNKSQKTGAFHFNERAVWDGLTVGGRKPCEGLIRDWVNWQKAKELQFEHLMKVLKTLSLPEEPISAAEPARVSRADGFDTPMIRTRYGVVPLTHASAGVRRVAGLAYLLVWAWREHGLASKLLEQEPERRIVLLVDEPETHLHPKWQRLVLPALLRATNVLMKSEHVDVQVVTATHSPLVLASLEPVFDEKRDSLCDLNLVTDEAGETQVAVTQVPWRLRGDVNAWLTSEVFDLKTTRSSEAEKVLDEAARAISNPASVDKARAQKLDQSLRKVLGDTDPFWVRWRYVGEQKGWLAK